MKLSGSQEDYLKAIWYMEKHKKRATAKSVADVCGVRPPTVLSMFRMLAKRQLITYNKTQGACLTAAGERIARKLVRKHRLIETFLEQVLQMDGAILHREAEKLEHVISDQLMHRIDAYLGFPAKDPHGSPIPVLSEDKQPVPLDQVREERSFVVKEINLNPDLTAYYAENSLEPGTLWTMQARFPDQSSFLLTNGKQHLPVSAQAAELILVVLRG